ncbi:hypothetical protein BC829DRAFT_378578, partial [Chytridium lagenaria]
MNRNEETGPSLIPHIDPNSQLLTLNPPAGLELTWTLPRLQDEFRSLLQRSIWENDPNSHHHRLLYAWVGTLFHETAPRPIGGKRLPGFVIILRGQRKCIVEIVEWVLDVSCRGPKCGRGFRVVPPGECMRFVVGKWNEVLKVWRENKKSVMNQMVMRGLEVVKHLQEAEGMPSYLKAGAKSNGVKVPQLQRQSEWNSEAMESHIPYRDGVPRALRGWSSNHFLLNDEARSSSPQLELPPSILNRRYSPTPAHYSHVPANVHPQQPIRYTADIIANPPMHQNYAYPPFLPFHLKRPLDHEETSLTSTKRRKAHDNYRPTGWSNPAFSFFHYNIPVAAEATERNQYWSQPHYQRSWSGSGSRQAFSGAYAQEPRYTPIPQSHARLSPGVWPAVQTLPTLQIVEVLGLRDGVMDGTTVLLVKN